MSDREYARRVMRETLEEYLRSTRLSRVDRIVAWCLGIALKDGRK